MTVANSPLWFPSRSGGPNHATIQIQPSDIWPSFSSLVFSVDVGYNLTKTTMVILAAVDMSTSTPRGAQVFTNKLGFALEGRCFNIARTVTSCDILWYQSYTSYRSQKKNWQNNDNKPSFLPYESTWTTIGFSQSAAPSGHIRKST